MSDKKTTVAYHGIGFPGLLTILFIGLKLTGQIDWDWIWVIAPLFLPLFILVAFILVIFFFGCIAVLLALIFDRK